MRFGLLTVNFSKAQMEHKKSTTKKNVANHCMRNLTYCGHLSLFVTALVSIGTEV